VVLVRFPFSDLAVSKKRPALIVSPPEFSARHGDVVLLAMTSQKQQDDLALQEWESAALPKPTWFKPLIATITTEVIVRRLGSLSVADRSRAVRAIRVAIAPEFLK